jgi:hypothetical protein
MTVAARLNALKSCDKVTVNVSGQHDSFEVYITKKEARYLIDRDKECDQFRLKLENGILEIERMGFCGVADMLH